MRNTLMLGAALAVLLAACSKPADNSTTIANDATPTAAPPAAAPAPAALTGADFVSKAAATDMFEIAEAKLATSTSHSAGVKTFAAMMIADHTKSTKALKAAIAKSGQALSPPTVLPTDLQAKVDTLKGVAPADFDKAYVADQTAAHQEALGVMQSYAAGGDVSELKSFASDTAQVVQKHLDAANALQAKMS